MAINDALSIWYDHPTFSNHNIERDGDNPLVIIKLTFRIGAFLAVWGGHICI